MVEKTFTYCDICTKKYKSLRKRSLEINFGVDPGGGTILKEFEDICPKCTDSIMKHMNMLIENKGKK